MPPLPSTIPLRKRPRLMMRIGAFALVALAIASLARFFVAEPFIVSGTSMLPTYHAGDYLVIDLISYRFDKPQRNDVIVFRYPLDPSLYFIKRIVALPGETIDESNGAVLSDARAASSTLKLANDEYYVLGDNPQESSDSRLWGPLQKKFIVGKVVWRVWPPLNPFHP